ncbi:hypothetical protein [Mycobacterium kyogaense]|uniref:hypothetical protein n=1 Tax=Mycobacterium kyogaense TaxID=2212479 RepID=UPI001F098FE8|nr:hypothetical protein [Mycobacterium kyogaense]
MAPEGVVFRTEPGTTGEVVFADFDIPDAVFMYLTKFGARSTTKEILQYARTEYPQASRVVVEGRFPTKDVYGNTENSVVLNVFYTRDTLDKINFAGIDNDQIWTVRDGGTIHPELQ